MELAVGSCICMCVFLLVCCTVGLSVRLELSSLVLTLTLRNERKEEEEEILVGKTAGLNIQLYYGIMAREEKKVQTNCN